jgi:hypothetical protein
MSGRAFHRVSASFGVAFAVVLSLGLIVSAPALAGGPPVGKIYDCYAFNEASGFENYIQAVELKTSSEYLVAPMRKGNNLSGKAARGRYRVHGTHMTFPTGPYAIHHFTGVFHPAGKGYKPHHENDYDNRFDVYDAGLNFMSCYEH